MTPRTITGQVKEGGEAHARFADHRACVLFAAGTLLHTFKALEKEATAHDADDKVSGNLRKG